jgi:hypothetical protein
MSFLIFEVVSHLTNWNFLLKFAFHAGTCRSQKAKSVTKIYDLELTHERGALDTGCEELAIKRLFHPAQRQLRVQRKHVRCRHCQDGLQRGTGQINLFGEPYCLEPDCHATAIEHDGGFFRVKGGNADGSRTQVAHLENRQALRLGTIGDDQLTYALVTLDAGIHGCVAGLAGRQGPAAARRGRI